MKLFTPAQTISEKEKQIVSDISRLKSVNDELKNKRKQLGGLEIEFNETLARQHEQWTKESVEHINLVNEMQIEVKRLEERKKQALIPLETKAKELLILEKTLTERDREQYLRECELEDIHGLLEEKLSHVAERETEIDRVYAIQKNRQHGIDLQSEQIKVQSKDFSEMMQKSLSDLDKKQLELTTKESMLSLREKANNDKEKQLIKIEQGFVERERVIKDKYATLERASKEIYAKSK